MPVSDLSSFKVLYLETAKENLQTLKNGLAKLATNPTDEVAIEVVHRSSHTLKSKSFVMGNLEIGNLAKTIEDTLYEVKNKTTNLSQDALQNLVAQTAKIEGLLLQI